METEMMRYSDNSVINILSSEFPSIVYANKTRGTSSVKELFAIIYSLSCYTRKQIEFDNLDEVQRCYLAAKEILKHGSNIARLAITNVYVYSVSRLLEKSFSASSAARCEFLRVFGKEYGILIKNNCP